MAEKSRVLVLIPTFGDFAGIQDLVDDVNLLGQEYVPLVVDDGSPDPIPIPAQALHTRLTSNYGLGVATHVALDHALAANYGYVVRIDGDGQHRVSDIPRIVGRLVGGADVVIGARSLERRSHGAREYLVFLAKQYFSALTRLVGGRQLPQDVTSGFQGFNRRAAKFLSRVELERYPEPHVLIVCARAGMTIEAVEVEEQEREHGKSTLSLAKGFQAFYRFNILLVRELLQGTGEK